jgi:hypothetical protein
MAGYDNIRMVGRNTTMYVAIQGPTEDPAGATLLPLGAVTTKSQSIEGNTLEANDSLVGSGFTEQQLASSSFSISVSGNYVRDPSLFPNYTFINALRKYRFQCATKELDKDPVILVVLEEPSGGVKVTAYMMISTISVEDNDSELRTFSMELVNAASPDYPPTMEDVA